MSVLKDNLPNYFYSDYKKWKGDWELINGIPYSLLPAPDIIHQLISAEITYQFRNKLKNCTVVPEMDWKISKNSVVRPDIIVVCNLRDKGQFLSQNPNILFEILSPSTKRKDRNLKYHLYENNKVNYYVIIEPAGMFAEVYKLKKGKYRLEGEFKEETYKFNLDDCKINFSFKKIFDI